MSKIRAKAKEISRVESYQPLPRSVRIGYGVGDFGFNLFFTTASLFLLYYYTDVLGLAPAVAGWVFAAALIWDALFDPAIGYIATQTRSRWGRYRPYILLGTIYLASQKGVDAIR
jgi:glycoside/pentoside/hexuronide:cation symporter, GPH family